MPERHSSAEALDTFRTTGKVPRVADGEAPLASQGLGPGVQRQGGGSLGSSVSRPLPFTVTSAFTRPAASRTKCIVDPLAGIA